MCGRMIDQRASRTASVQWIPLRVALSGPGVHRARNRSRVCTTLSESGLDHHTPHMTLCGAQTAVWSTNAGIAGRYRSGVQSPLVDQAAAWAPHDTYQRMWCSWAAPIDVLRARDRSNDCRRTPSQLLLGVLATASACSRRQRANEFVIYFYKFSLYGSNNYLCLTDFLFDKDLLHLSNRYSVWHRLTLFDKEFFVWQRLTPFAKQIFCLTKT